MFSSLFAYWKGFLELKINGIESIFLIPLATLNSQIYAQMHSSHIITSIIFITHLIHNNKYRYLNCFPIFKEAGFLHFLRLST